MSAGDYRFVRRLRHRRLLGFLQRQGFHAALISMCGETDAAFCAARLGDLVERGLWRDAVEYLSRFLPPDLGGLEAQVLYHFLCAHMTLASILFGTDQGVVWFPPRAAISSPGADRINYVLARARKVTQRLRDGLDWDCVREAAALSARGLAYATPELQGKLVNPHGPLKHRDVLPLGFSSGPRRHRKKQSCRPPQPSTHLAERFLLKRKSLLAPPPAPMPLPKPPFSVCEFVATTLDESLHAGLRLPGYPRQLNGVPVQKPLCCYPSFPHRWLFEWWEKHPMGTEASTTDAAEPSSKKRKRTEAELIHSV